MIISDFTMAPACRDTQLDFNRTRLYTYLSNRDAICNGTPCADGISFNSSTGCWADNYELNPAGTAILPQTFSTPAADNAPWYDPSVPESARFLGFYLLDISGLESTFSRDVKPRTVGQDGGSLGPLRAKQRTMGFKILAFGCDEAALDYGLRWLIYMMTGECDACGGCDAWVRFSCSDTPVSPTLADWQDQRWQLKNVALTEGPIYTQPPIVDMSCKVRAVDFTLTAADPYFYKDAEVCTSDTWVPPGSPVCFDFCDWITDIVGHSYQVCCEVDASQTIGETLLNFSISTGATGMAQLDIVGKDVGTGCDDVTTDTFFTMSLANIPAHTTVEIDTANNRITATTGSVTRDAFDLIDVTDTGTTFGFPRISNRTACFCAVVNACSVANDASCTITTQYRVA